MLFRDYTYNSERVGPTDLCGWIKTLNLRIVKEIRGFRKVGF